MSEEVKEERKADYGEVNGKDIKKVYDLIEFGIVNDTDGKVWFMARSKCDTVICAGNFKPDFYEVSVQGPEEKREYSGGPDSDAFKTYTNLAHITMNRNPSLS